MDATARVLSAVRAYRRAHDHWAYLRSRAHELGDRGIRLETRAARNRGAARRRLFDAIDALDRSQSVTTADQNGHGRP